MNDQDLLLQGGLFERGVLRTQTHVQSMQTGLIRFGNGTYAQRLRGSSDGQGSIPTSS